MNRKNKRYVGKYELEKFNGKNDFGYWTDQMNDIFISQGLHKAFQEKLMKPAETIVEDWAAQASTRMTDDAWKELDLNACATIRLSLERDVQVGIRTETTAAEIWQKLEN